MRIAIVIPARYASSRLPGKPLLDIHGKPMVQHVYERASQARGVDHVVVATDDARIFDAVRSFGGQAVMTRDDHPSGTDRLAEVMAKLPAEVYINVQGDEPMIRPGDIEILADGMRADPAIAVATLCHPISVQDAEDPNQVKVVLADNGDALYFSRARIPYVRDADTDTAVTYLKHIGIYAYRHDVLRDYARLPRPVMERAEQLEQLRLLAAGLRIRALQVEAVGPGVDTPEGLERVRALMAG
ncbi:3-deoxy-manno-octulosonate cytidylyltransferase [Kerstersia gyiorum]|uniref:3-deoxy-manno-octulosonate cytidylyltransferase n=1 Tax=Kerstersia gyiorum TaxID=206506 RepID=UPI0010713B9F|nr:3-deoxy-manno-octulosonate cytidylyltransferase [Kerstersia gyiorum]QBR41448.1 3-deoxy-manno-octulosonate cytidylyltransferase [Kerstersia gyiorum]